MSNENVLSRREFTLEAALAILGGVAITVSACGGDTDDSPTSPSPSPSPSGATGTISANHGHSATITGAELTAMQQISLNIQGSSEHPHTVLITQADLSQISAGQRVSKVSTTDAGHSHTVTFN